MKSISFLVKPLAGFLMPIAPSREGGDYTGRRRIPALTGRGYRRCWAALAVCPVLLSQGLLMQGPTSGVVFESSTSSIRPILGLAGGAHLGSAIYTGLDYASIAPDGRSALAVQSGQLILIQDLANRQSAPLSGTISHVDRILWAADSS